MTRKARWLWFTGAAIILTGIIIAVGVILPYSIWPSEKLLKSWHKYEDDLFIIYYPPNSDIAGHVREWAEARKKVFAENCAYLGVNWTYQGAEKVRPWTFSARKPKSAVFGFLHFPRASEALEKSRAFLARTQAAFSAACYGPITFFVFNDYEQGREYGYRLGFARPQKRMIFTMHNQTPGHELTHLIAHRINEGHEIKSPMIKEGLATFLSGVESPPGYKKELLDYLNEIKLRPGNMLGWRFRRIEDGYALAFTFVDFLIQTYGLERFKQFYAQDRYGEEESYQVFYGKRFEDLFKDWRRFLEN